MKSICFIGAPGSGKSTQIKKLSMNLHQKFNIFHGKVTKLIFLEDEIKKYINEEELKWIEEQMDSTRREKRLGNLASIEYDQLLIEITKRLPEESVILFDGFPRSYNRAELFLQQQHLIKDTIVIQLQFENDEFEHSISRQFFRGLKKRGFNFVLTEFDRFFKKTEIYQSETLKGVALLNEKGIPVFSINALLPISSIEQRIEEIAIKHLECTHES
ncbi:nucleoside monophosphate kinase [Bacillus timonensis]|nr:nucleoside monophosphate kinase [Bacillus timonensis]